MADSDILISELPSASQINTNDLVLLTQPDAQAETGYTSKKGTTLEVFNKALKGTEFSTDLPSFTDKTVLGGMRELKGDIYDLLPVDTASGAIASFTTALGIDLIDVKAQITATGGGGTPSTPVPINGYTEANITRCGVNLWNEATQTGRWSNVVGQKCEVVADNTRFCNSTPIRIAPSTQYTFVVGNYGACILMLCDADMIVLEVVNMAQDNTFTTPATAKYLCFYPYITGQTYTDGISLNQGTDNTYHAYNSNTYTIAFGQTVYGGVLDVTRGKLTVTHGYADLGDFTYTYYSQYLLFTTDLTDGIKREITNINVLCDSYAGVIGYGTNGINNISLNDVICVGSNYVAPNANLLIRNTDYTDENAFKTAVTGVKFAYVLATPFDIDLTPEVISAIVGANNVFADTGNIEVKFKDTIQNYIDKKIAATQALIL